MLTNEAIEVHLSYLRPAVEALTVKVDQLHTKLEEKIDQANKDRAAGDAMLAAKIDQANEDRIAGDAMLAEKIDQATKDRAAGDAMLAEKIDLANKDRIAGDAKLIELVMKIQGSQEGLKWFISSITLLASGVSIAHSLGWI